MALLTKADLNHQRVNKAQALVWDFLLQHGLLLGELEKYINIEMASERNYQERKGLFVLQDENNKYLPLKTPLL